jgi:hypothetical protein
LSKYPDEPITWRQKKDGSFVGWANKPLEIVVQQRDIVAGIPCDSEQCVLALALRRSFLGFIDGFVVGKYITLIFSDNGEKVVQYETPAKLRSAINHLDTLKNWPLKAGETVRFLPFPLNRRKSRHHKRRKPQPGRKPSTFAKLFDGSRRYAPRACQVTAGTFRSAVNTVSKSAARSLKA